MIPRDLIRSLAIAIDKNNLETIESLVSSIKPADFATHNRVEILGHLRLKREFVLLERVSSLFLALCPNDIYLQIQFIRSLVEQGKIDTALSLLENIDTATIKSRGEESEFIGLKGRAYKQAYLNSEENKYLTAAANHYREGWNLGKADVMWHGINLVALNHLNPNKKKIQEAKEIAEQIIANIEKRLIDHVSDWDCATAFEAHLALGNTDKAMRWLKQYINNGPSAFLLNSTLRQAEEIWKLNQSDDGKLLIQPLQAAALINPGGVVTFSKDQLNTRPSVEHFEKIWDEDGAEYVEWFETLIKRTRVTCRVKHKDTGKIGGSGFVFSAEKLNKEWKDKVLFATNAHVVSELDSDQAPLKPSEVYAEFTKSNQQRIGLGDQVFHSPRNHYDISIYQIKTRKFLDQLELVSPVTKLPEIKTDNELDRKMIVIGHPKGGEMKISLFNSLLEQIDEPYILYTSSTEQGSSGSPVFNSKLNLVGIHHRADDFKKLNKGTAFKYIKELM